MSIPSHAVVQVRKFNEERDAAVSGPLDEFIAWAALQGIEFSSRLAAARFKDVLCGAGRPARAGDGLPRQLVESTAIRPRRPASA